MDFNDYQKKSYIAIQPHENDKDEILNWAVGLSEEVGEVMNIIKHHCWGGEEINKLELAKEIGDMLWYASALALKNGIKLDGIAELNLRKLEHRFKGHFSVEKSKQRKQKELSFEKTEVFEEIMKGLFI